MRQSESIRTNLYVKFENLLKNINEDAVKEYCLNWALIASYVNQDLETETISRN